MSLFAVSGLKANSLAIKYFPELTQVATSISTNPDAIPHVKNECIDFHKYYLSVSNVTYSQKAKALQMISRYFIDDLEDVLNERLEKRLQLGNADDLPELKPILERYFSNRIRIKVDGKESIPTVIGAEYDVDQIVVYLEIPADMLPKSIEISNKSLIELFPDQKNLTHFKINNQRKSLLNSRDTPTDSVKF
ncbi:DUF6702 family protein [Nonlabens antarcticus]|uniref:DUF6702 family protein n=1 Tax=Nonlabens antarcticus TaxID=392714 RepID=UPI00189104D8|nr:DUF6702 family protein [Nonlabens antarcticus]